MSNKPETRVGRCERCHYYTMLSFIPEHAEELTLSSYDMIPGKVTWRHAGWYCKLCAGTLDRTLSLEEHLYYLANVVIDQLKDLEP